MKHIIHLVFLGVISGMITCFYTRITKTNMIFGFIGKWLQKQSKIYYTINQKHSVLIKFLHCNFCIHFWIMLVLALFYILTFNPWWMFCVVGVAGGLGAGNLVAEFVCSLRNEQ